MSYVSCFCPLELHVATTSKSCLHHSGLLCGDDASGLEGFTGNVWS